jgi:hypothetical protein
MREIHLDKQNIGDVLTENAWGQQNNVSFQLRNGTVLGNDGWMKAVNMGKELSRILQKH